MHPRSFSLRALGATLVLATAASAHAQTRTDIIEHLFGATAVNAVAGHGRLTAGVSDRGDLTVLAWPGPSYADQLLMLSSNDIEARDLPLFGADEGMGSFLGLLVKRASGTELVWLRDARFRVEQTYSRPDSVVPKTRFTSDALGLDVTLWDIVSPDSDVLTRRVRVTKRAASDVAAVSLVVYENLSPSLSKVPELPFTDWMFDNRNDFIALYDEQLGAIVHTSPEGNHVLHSLLDFLHNPLDTDFGTVDWLMQQPEPSASAVQFVARSLDLLYAPGVTALVTTSPAPADFQVGLDETPFCAYLNQFVDNLDALPSIIPPTEPSPVNPALYGLLRCQDALPELAARKQWRWTPEDALSDVSDGVLSRSRVAAGQTNGALITQLTFADGVAEGSVMIAFGRTPSDARSALKTVAALSPEQRLARAEAKTASLLATAKLPSAQLGDKARDIAMRALLNTYVARDASTGAILASVSRQPMYYLDWPRDGAFISAGLDAWEMNYVADGTAGGPMRFEIDNTALHVWSIGLHAAHLKEPERLAFVQKVWPTTRRAVELLLRFRELDTGLPAPASEDDSALHTSTIHSAATVLATMDAGARLARYLGQGWDAFRYAQDAAALRSRIMKHYGDDPSGLLRRVRGQPPPVRDVAVAWAIWPGRLYAPGDARIEKQLNADLDELIAQLQGSTEGIYYATKTILSGAIYGAPNGARLKAKRAFDLLTEVAVPGVNHFGEGYLAFRDAQGKLTWSNRVATPHVWSGMLYYMCAMALSDPTPFLLDDQLLPARPGD